MDNSEPDYRKIHDALIQYISERKAEIYEMIRVDRNIDADNYTNVAKLKEVEKIEKVLRRNQ